MLFFRMKLTSTDWWDMQIPSDQLARNRGRGGGVGRIVPSSRWCGGVSELISWVAEGKTPKECECAFPLTGPVSWAHTHPWPARSSDQSETATMPQPAAKVRRRENKGVVCVRYIFIPSHSHHPNCTATVKCDISVCVPAAE